MDSGPFHKRARTSSPQHHSQEKGAQNGNDDIENKKYMYELPSIPTFEMANLKNMTCQEFLKKYNLYQAIHFKAERVKGDVDVKTSESKNNNNNTTITWKDIGSIFKDLDRNDRISWCIENHEIKDDKESRNNQSRYEKISGDKFLLPTIEGIPKEQERAYCSFLVQKDKGSYWNTLERLPMSNLCNIDEHWSYEPCLWIFFGRNNRSGGNSKGNSRVTLPLEGRGLHTDSVSHDGTWHYQLSGSKEWFLSPSCDLLRHWKDEMKNYDDKDTTSGVELEKWNESTNIHVSCHEGDVIVVNTRLWFHRTVIPNQKYPSVSYARDFRLETTSKIGSSEHSRSRSNVENNDNGEMTNLDGLYARNEIEPGTIIFTEKDMPDCELHRSKENPNCEVVELDNGTSAVVSRRTITCGEFFCVAESSDEEEAEECSDEDEHDGQDDESDAGE